MKKVKNLLSILLALSMILCMAACGSKDAGSGDASNTASNSPSDNSGTATNTGSDGEKVFVYGADANCTTFDPYNDLQNKSGNFLLHAVGDTLWNVDADGNMVYRLATNVEWTDDLTMKVTLREGVKFSNGNDFTAEDVLYTLQLLYDTPRTLSMVSNVDMENTVALSDYEVSIAFTKYDAAFTDAMGNPSFFMLDKDSYEADPNHTWIIGTGPYKLKGDGETDTSGWEESVQYTLVRNENYWGEAPYYDTLIVRFFSEESTRYAELQAGNLDAAYFSQATYIKDIGNGKINGFNLVQTEMPNVRGFAMAISDRTRGTFSDINIRKAFAHGMDITSMVEVVGDGVYKVADSILSSSSWAYLQTGTYEYDPEYAAECLAEAGYSVDNPLTIELVCENNALYSSIAETAQAYLSQIGINLDLSGVGDYSTILPSLIAADFDVCIDGAYNGSGADPANSLQKMGPLSNTASLAVMDEDISQLFLDALSSNSIEERTELYHQFQQAVHDGYYFIPMWVETSNFAVSDAHPSFSSCIDTSGNFDPTKLAD